MSALVLAVYNAQYDFAKALLDLGADPDTAGNGWTALHQVVWTNRPNLGRNPAVSRAARRARRVRPGAGPGCGGRGPRRPSGAGAEGRQPEHAQPPRVDAVPAGGEGGRRRDDAASGRPRGGSLADHRAGGDPADGVGRRRHLENRRRIREPTTRRWKRSSWRGSWATTSMRPIRTATPRCTARFIAARATSSGSWSRRAPTSTP